MKEGTLRKVGGLSLDSVQWLSVGNGCALMCRQLWDTSRSGVHVAKKLEETDDSNGKTPGQEVIV